MEFHRTPFLGSLIEAANLPAYQEEDSSALANSKVLTNQSFAEICKSAGNEIKRIISATSSFPQVAVVHPEPHLRSRRGNSALTAMLDHVTYETEWNHLIVSWLGEIEGLEAHESLTGEQIEAFNNLLGPTNIPVWLDGPPTKWREYAEQVLWPTLHYTTSVNHGFLERQLEYTNHGWQSYVEFNEKYAEIIIQHYQKGDVIMIHDMYLLLLPSLLRCKIPDALIGLYIHSPFPSSELFRTLAQRTSLLNGMLGSTIVGFHSKQYIKHFVSAATRLTGIESTGSKLLFNGRYVDCVALPFGINVKQLMERCKSKEVHDFAQEIRELYSDKLIIVGRDKLDYTQGILQKLRAYWALLELYPSWKGSVVLVQITTATWQNSTKLEQQMSHLISHINSTYGDIDYSPIVHFSRHMNQDEYYALLKTADVGFFTPLREGGSSAAVEYVLCQTLRNDNRAIAASMVLSEFMGITDLMAQGGTPVNPYDPLQVACVLNQALGMNRLATKSNQDIQIYKTARTRYDVAAFFSAFLNRLVMHDLKNENRHYTPEANISELSSTFSHAKRKLILLDYDGTLTPIVKDPAAAVPSERLKKILNKLGQLENTTLWVISGRDMGFLDKHLSKFKINLSAEHGCYVKFASSKPNAEWEDLVSKIDMSWMDVVMNILQSYTERTEGSNIEKKKSAITWHYRRSDPEFGAFQASHLRAYLELTVAQKYPIDVMAGKANVEIRPKLFSKGEIVNSIFKISQEKNESPEFVLCIGDDTTDEDMFRVLCDQKIQSGYYPVLVGPKTKLTMAKWHVNTVADVHDLLEALES